jgi:predicted 3-demethylubiquinone-9 3-methyltransferase (glyoxalase superfamily)
MTNTIYPCLWFDGHAKNAADFYCSVFENSAITANTPMVVNFELNGTKFMGLNGGPGYKVNSAISYYVYCGNDTEISRLYKILTEGGGVLMPLGKYDWSEKYAWVMDRFGVNWQLDIDRINSTQTIVPSLLFANEKFTEVKNAIAFYTQTFKNSKILLEAPYPAGASVSKGALLFAQFKLDGAVFNAMSSTIKHDFDFTPGNSFVVECDTQEEIDYYWNKLTEGGEESMCGWLKDKFGVSWQIVPAILGKLMSDPERAPRVTQAFLKMKKFDIEKLMEA